ncbi:MULTISPECIES: MlaC/ttg2D family ABC transporter substrate-binding protein [Shimia]|uniref:MlaC/ttg2D family ABC transporter substrate-binding protein n=1 Tax=Shimia TaxID=573139 RepID=UPI001FB4B37A|nr:MULTISPECIES: ABC transporter substrate-binding protein [Shimia]MDV4144950.1 ABC transporter substrate-binding protein [Shimia sp. FJ5]
MQSETTRRMFLGGVAASGLVALTPARALALSDAQATQLVDRVVADINKVIASGGSLSQMISQFERIFARYADVPIIARSALGVDARRASSGQLRAYTSAFQGYIARKYGKRFEEFVGGEITVQGTRQVKSFHEVRASVKLRGQSPFQVNFLVSDKSGKPRFFDMIIEGISLRLSEKEEIGAMLDRRKGNIDQLVADLKSAG